MLTRWLTAAVLATALAGVVSPSFTSSASADRIFFDNRDLDYLMLPHYFEYGSYVTFDGTGLDITRSPASHVTNTPALGNPHFWQEVYRVPFSSTELVFDRFVPPAGSTLAVQQFFVSEGEDNLQGQLPRLFLDGEAVSATSLGSCFGGDFCGPFSAFGFQPGLRKYLGDEGVVGYQVTLDGQTHFAYLWMKFVEFGDRPDAYAPIGWGYDDTPGTPVQIFIPGSSC